MTRDELTQALREAKGPNFMLEREIANVIGWPKEAIPKAWTASLDAAMTLVRGAPIVRICVNMQPERLALVYIEQVKGATVETLGFGHSKTPALALCIAALEADALARSQGRNPIVADQFPHLRPSERELLKRAEAASPFKWAPGKALLTGNNAALLNASRTAIPALLQEVDRLRGALTHVAEECEATSRLDVCSPAEVSAWKSAAKIARAALAPKPADTKENGWRDLKRKMPRPPAYQDASAPWDNRRRAEKSP